MPSKLTKSRHTGPNKPMNCPTCGCPVRVGGKRTTHYYIPTPSPAVEALVEAGQLILMTIDTDKEVWESHIKQLRAALAAVEADRRAK